MEFDEYRLVEILGRGAMGVVYLARDTLLDRSVAIKFISGLGLSPQMIERFLNEARAAARIQHPNVVAVYRVGELQARPYLVSEFIRGKSLEQEAIPIAWDRARDLAYGLASGLAAAHRCGVLHRDIKPANAIVASDGQVKLVDFGLAKLNDDIPDRLSAFERISQPVAAPVIRAEALLLRSSGDVAVPVDLSSTPGTGRRKRKSDGGHLRAVRSTFAESPEAPETSAWTAYVRKSSSAAAWPSLHEVSEARPTGAVSMTRAGQIVGTPLFLAPELWEGTPATTQSDVYALGALVYELCAGAPPHDAEDLDALSALVRTMPIAPILQRAPGIDVGFAEVIMRCLARDPAQRFRDGEAVREALEKLRPRTEALLPPEGNPYRGLSTFEAEHRALFFGRATECGAVLERLRQGQLVLVAGDSGVGKSSLCRAAVLPLVADGALAEGRKWTSHAISPGRRPLLALAGAIAAEMPGTSEEELMQRVLDGGPGAAAAELRKALGDKRGVVLFVDQLEELVTIADGAEAQAAADLLAALSRAGRGVRVLATVRGDLLTRLASLGALADAMMSALYLLKPLSEEGVREAIVGPARAKKVDFESEELVRRLTLSCTRAEGGLPLLQFALQELWEARDVARGLITAAALEHIGGVEAALARHADEVIRGLLPAWRRSARTILTMLASADLTRRQRLEHELFDGSTESKQTLEALVRGRILLARDALNPDETSYEIAHDALLRGWATLRSWLESDAGRRLIQERLARAAEEWERLGRGEAGLWTEQQLAEIAGLEPEDLRPSERAFVETARAASRRRRWRRIALIAGAPLALLLVVGAVRLNSAIERSRNVEKHLASARESISRFRDLEASVRQGRQRAFAAFDQAHIKEAEEAWAKARKVAIASRSELESAEAALDRARVVDPGRADVFAMMGATYYDIALASEAARTLTAAEVQRIELFDDGGALLRRWNAPGTVRIQAAPTGSQATLARYRAADDGKLRLELLEKRISLPTTLQLDPGSYVLTVSAPEHREVRYPIFVSRGEEIRLEPRLAHPSAIPAGFIPIPGGSFFFGSEDEGLRSSFFRTAPLHRRVVEPFAIAAHETTLGEWIEFLEALPEAERQRRTPGVSDALTGSLSLTRERRRWHFSFRPADRSFEADVGEPIEYPRAQGATQDWLKMPVTGVSFQDAVAYAEWLDKTNRIPGARLCSEIEWERAARGADARRYPHGDSLRPTDANYFGTYGELPAAVGLDEVGSHPDSDSPFGVHDLAGNAFEWVTSDLRSSPDDIAVFRSGSYYQSEVELRAENRNPGIPTTRDIRCGLRICAPWK